jgi:iron-sulfur cluster assembly protein
MTEPTIVMTPKAVQAAKKQLAKRASGSGYLRLGVLGGSCSGYSYHIEWADEKHSRDLELVFDDLKVVVDPKSMTLLTGSTLDYEAKLIGGGFSWKNPNAVSKCGCGSSFDIAPKEDE